ncbi:Fic family protein [Desulfuromonas carbonis]|uniref:Fic family protein n=1 Tax=Desulfuromonas sp. DDH964 TaxID=1823759 RepID=UPI00078DA94A|nr:Fic family protein [Desulfuromonas sp. DDH964]AMV73202.1 cell filamentation protein Fic [Desulfuromonas sp. DDH964]
MPDSISQMTPLLPEGADDLQDLALEVVQRSASLGTRQHPVTLHTLRELLRIINSYYSNLIEGHNTHPYDIVRAMRQQYDAEPAKRNLQLESIAHITVQQQMEEWLHEAAPPNIAGQKFLCSLHQAFFVLLPEEFLVMTNPDNGRECRVVPGELRTQAVKVGQHQPPGHDSLGAFMGRFGEAYAPEKHHGAAKLVAAAAAHHRLMWIHPFLDGNGRVARLFTEAYLHRIPVQGFGLWSVSRGLARRNADYKSALTWADAPRRNDLDGRGNLSNEGLVKFCRFFLEVCLDQVDYMGTLLQLDGLVERVRNYVQLRGTAIIPNPPGKDGLRPEAARMLQEVLLLGEAPRGAVVEASGLKERTGRNVLGQLISEGLLVSDTPKGNVRIGLPIHAAGWFFPELFPVLSR